MSTLSKRIWVAKHCPNWSIFSKSPLFSFRCCLCYWPSQIAMLFLASKGYKVKLFFLGYSIDPPQQLIQQSISPAERLLSSVAPIEEDLQETEKTQAKNATELDISAAPESSGTNTKIAASTSGSSSKQRKNKKNSQYFFVNVYFIGFVSFSWLPFTIYRVHTKFPKKIP